MKKTNIAFLILGIFLLHGTAWAQVEPDSLLIMGKHHQIYSKTLEEDRPYWVYLPQGYEQDTQKRYPVIYLLDGEMNFKTMIGIQSFFNRGRSPMPKAIIIGIENTDRTRDLTPTPAISEKGQATLQNSGGAEQFIRFLSEELIPTLDQQFRTSKRRILIGHSFGGLFTIHVLLKHPALFSDYLAMDPSMWWDGGRLLKEAEELLRRQSNRHVRLFLSNSKEQAHHGTPSEGKRHTLPDLLEEIHPKGLQWKYRYFEEETHGSVILPALFYGMRFLYGPEQGLEHDIVN